MPRRKPRRNQDESETLIPARKKGRGANEKLHRTTQASEVRLGKIAVTPQTPNQKKLWETLQEKMLTVVVGPAGSGKTYLSAYAAATALVRKDVLNIFISRPMVTVGKEIGHLPGSELDKMLPYVAPMIEYFNEFFGPEEVQKMLKSKVIRVVPIALLRGYTFKDTFVIIDEAQNTTPHEFKTIITRMGEGSKMVVLGDLDQSDVNTRNFVSGPEDFVRRMHEPNKNIGVAELTEEDILRSELVKDIVGIYKQDYVDA
jgi:phosphate starvation-inducible PhoH-like protein